MTDADPPSEPAPDAGASTDEGAPEGVTGPVADAGTDPATGSEVVDLGIPGLTDPVEIGVGGFATVYKAEQPAFRRTVAVKVIAALNLDEAAKERFERECQAMGSLSEHPNIVSVYDAGFTGNGRPYMLMAHLPGGSLQDRIDARGTLTWQEATMIGIHLAGALETAHRAEVIHRDIKPANVLMSAYGDAQLTDFGIARISGGHETRSGVITASMAHAPPEVLDGQRPAIASDIYSLGSTIFELMHGVPAFQQDGDESMVPMLRRILTDAPPDLRSRGVPDEVCAVIEKSMAKEPSDRQESALQFGRQLQAARRAAGLDPGKLTVPTEQSLDEDSLDSVSFVSSDAIDTATLTGRQEYQARTIQVSAPAAPDGTYVTEAEKSKGKGALIAAAAVLVVAMVAIGIFAATRPKDDQAARSTTTTRVGDTKPPPAYNATLERRFLGACEGDDPISQDFCRCVYEGAQKGIEIRRFNELLEEAERPSRFEYAKTELGPIVDGCKAEAQAKIDAATSTTPPPETAPPEETTPPESVPA